METNMNYRMLFSSGARLVRRHVRLVIWIFFVNLILAWLSIGPVRNSFSPFLDHSIASQRLVDQFDMAAMIELVREPDIQLHSLASTSMHFAVVFLIYMVFINGGVLTVFHENRKLSKAEFFEMSGGFFWRTLRLLLLSLIPFAMLGGLFSALSGWSDKLTENAANARTGFWVLVAGSIVLWALFLFVRAWFDIAQSTAVARYERGMLRSTGRAFMMLIRNLGTLLSTYACIHIVGMVAMIALCLIVVYIPHARFRLSFVVLEILVLIEIAVRLWQKAASMTWVDGLPVVTPPAPSYEPVPQADVTPMPTPETI
jgi:hypothetical protein